MKEQRFLDDVIDVFEKEDRYAFQIREVLFLMLSWS